MRKWLIQEGTGKVIQYIIIPRSLWSVGLVIASLNRLFWSLGGANTHRPFLLACEASNSELVQVRYVWLHLFR